MDRTQDAVPPHGQPPAEGMTSTLLGLFARLDPVATLAPPYQRGLAGAARLTRRAAGDVLTRRNAPEPQYLWLVSGAVTVVRPADNLATLLEAGDAPLRTPVYMPGDRTEVTVTRHATVLVLPAEAYARQHALAYTRGPEHAPEVRELDDWHQLDGLERALGFGVLAHLPVDHVQSIVSRLTEVDAAAGEKVFEQGTEAEYFYIVKSGSAEVCRMHADGSSTRLTVKVAGDTFGDDALVTGGHRNATVRMLTQGTLLRVAREDFKAFIERSLMSPVTLEAAHELVAQGARWLDLREPESFAREALDGASNVPISLLRTKRAALDPTTAYVCYSDEPATSALGCYLLAERGLRAYFVAELIPHFAALGAPPEPAVEVADSDAAAADAERRSTDALVSAAPPEVPTMLLRQLIAVERRRFDRLLAERTALIKRTAERQMNEKIAATDRALRDQVQARLLLVRRQQEALLEEARKLNAREEALRAQVAELEARRQAFELEKSTLRADLELSAAI